MACQEHSRTTREKSALDAFDAGVSLFLLRLYNIYNRRDVIKIILKKKQTPNEEETTKN